MTRKDYILIGDMLKYNRKGITDALRENRSISIEGVVKSIERDLCDVFASDNPKFSAIRFMDYIGHEKVIDIRNRCIQCNRVGHSFCNED